MYEDGVAGTAAAAGHILPVARMKCNANGPGIPRQVVRILADPQFHSAMVVRTASPSLLFSVALCWLSAGCGTVDSDPPPDAPTLVAPADGSEDEADVLELQWNSAQEADRYHLQVAEDPSFQSLLVDEPGLSSVHYVLQDLEIGATYYWRLRSGNESGFGDWSPARRFIPAEAARLPAIPRLVSPATGVEDMPTDIYFEWAPIHGASTYHLQVSLEENFVRRSADLDGIRGDRVLIRELVPTYIYYWRVRSVNPLGVSGWSEVRVLEIEDLAVDLPTS
jgi:hypothetical protein